MPDTTQTPDPLAAYLAEVRQAVATGPIADARRLLAAVERVLELAATWESQVTGTTATEIVFRDCALETQSEIRAALLGEEQSGG